MKCCLLAPWSVPCESSLSSICPKSKMGVHTLSVGWLGSAQPSHPVHSLHTCLNINLVLMLLGICQVFPGSPRFMGVSVSLFNLNISSPCGDPSVVFVVTSQQPYKTENCRNQHSEPKKILLLGFSEQVIHHGHPSATLRLFSSNATAGTSWKQKLCFPHSNSLPGTHCTGEFLRMELVPCVSHQPPPRWLTSLVASTGHKAS